MSIDIWPPVTAQELKLKEAEAQERELKWIVDETLEVCQYLRHGLEDCYALLAPIDPGSTLVMSTPRNEKVKGTITRVGTRIVKGSLHVQLRTMPSLALSLSQTSAVHIQALDTIHTLLTQSIDMLGLTLHKDRAADVQSLASNLTVLSESLSECTKLLKGPPLTSSDPGWRLASVPPEQFSPALGPNLSLHFSLQESCVVLWLRALEPVHAPVHFGTKLGLAIGTVRRLEHDEMDIVFKYNPLGSVDADCKRTVARHPTGGMSKPPLRPSRLEDVYVREKVRVESADPSLISLYSKLGHLNNVLDQARNNLTAVMGLEQDA
ncbi:unnamed protein product [Clonostachys rhizophaga]|uniref:37S ribosomal protein rsm22 n=1 Tax=Clonostachys rhizophaga TaxID=160324 RepID=A0A9N9VJE0_9HYPO|nr:unnamed protein product [Clonostachys rhizophaga]